MRGWHRNYSLYIFMWNILSTFLWIFLLTDFATGYTPNQFQNNNRVSGSSPYFAPSQQNYTFYEGHLAVLSCGVENLGTKTVVWRKISEENPLTVGKVTFVGDSRIQTHHVVHKNQWNLHIRNVKLSDAGVYECQISRKRKEFYLKVEEKTNDAENDHSGIMMTGNFHVEIGETLHMTCNATESDIPLEDIAWFKGGAPIQPSDRIKIYKQISLKGKTIKSDIRIEKVEMGDTGYYLCRTTDHLTTHKHVQVLNTAVNKDKRGTIIDTQTYKEQMQKKNHSTPRVPGKVLIFIAFLMEFLRNAL